ncbi:MAG: phage portal protein [Clostridia bacterium]|nr:phage portal protein [Clostridia bacterium]
MGRMEQLRSWWNERPGKKNGASREDIKLNNAGQIALWLGSEGIECAGYTRLCDCPEIQTACLRIAELIGSMTIHLMNNTENGDERIVNELSRKIDIEPFANMTRTEWMTAVVMNLLLHGAGNSVVMPHTSGGILEGLEPISAGRVTFRAVPGSYRDYQVLIDGRAHDPAELLHFTYNPDPVYLWKGRGITVVLKDVANNLRQAQKTENAFMKSEWKPSIIVKVDGLTEEFASPEGRARLLEDYVKPSTPGAPWMIPSEAFSVEQVRPLTLADLAIKDTIELDKKTVASVIGVPAYLLGVGEFNRDEWNNFIQTKIRAIALGIQQEMTRALIVSPKWYLQLNLWSLMDYDLGTVSSILLAGADRGYVCGDEWRDRMHMAPAGLRDYKVLENYIPYEDSGKQKKLIQDE